MCSWKKTLEVWPALFVSGGSFAVFPISFATFHLALPAGGLRDVELYPMTDIGGGIFSLVATAIFLQFWKPRENWHFDKVKLEETADRRIGHARRNANAAGAERTPPRRQPSSAQAAGLRR